MRIVVLISAAMFVTLSLAQPESDVVAAAQRALSTEYPEYDWENEFVLFANVDEDLLTDVLFLGLGDQSYSVALLRGTDSDLVPFLTFDISNSIQMASCGAPRGFEARPRSEAPFEALGAYPHGYDDCMECQEIVVVDDGYCDPLILFWNTVTSRLDGWRA